MAVKIDKEAWESGHCCSINSFTDLEGRLCEMGELPGKIQLQYRR